MNNNEIIIRLADGTSDSKFSGADVEQKAIETATKTKTEAKKKENDELGKQLGLNIANQVTGGKVSQISGIAAAAINPAALSAMTLAMMISFYKRIDEMSKRFDDTNLVRFKAGGINRSSSTINSSESRVNFITGRIVAENTTVGRR